MLCCNVIKISMMQDRHYGRDRLRIEMTVVPIMTITSIYRKLSVFYLLLIVKIY